MRSKQQIITTYLADRWYKKTLIITNEKQDCYDDIQSVEMTICSGFVENVKIGCIFETIAWPFRCKTFDLIILDSSFIKNKKYSKEILSQLYFCLSDDGEIIVAGTYDIRAYSLASKFIASGFLSKKIELIEESNNILVNICSRFVSKKFVVIFKKDKMFYISGVDVASIINKTTKSGICNGISAKQTCREHYEQK